MAGTRGGKSQDKTGSGKDAGPAISRQERRARALNLRKAGASYELIATQLGYSSKSLAYRDIKTAIAAITAEPAKDVLALELERLDALLLGQWSAATQRGGGDPRAVDRVLKIMARRSAYLGLDAQAGPGDVSEVAAWLLSMGAKLPPSVQQAAPE